MKIFIAILLIFISYSLGCFFPVKKFINNDGGLEKTVLFLEPMSDVLVMINSGDINAAKKELQASIFGTLVAIHMECAENKMSLDEKERKLVLSIFEKASNSTSGFIPIDDPVMALLRDPESCFSQ